MGLFLPEIAVLRDYGPPPTMRESTYGNWSINHKPEGEPVGVVVNVSFGHYGQTIFNAQKGYRTKPLQYFLGSPTRTCRLHNLQTKTAPDRKAF